MKKKEGLHTIIEKKIEVAYLRDVECCCVFFHFFFSQGKTSFCVKFHKLKRTTFVKLTPKYKL